MKIEFKHNHLLLTPENQGEKYQIQAIFDEQKDKVAGLITVQWGLEDIAFQLSDGKIQSKYLPW